MSLYTSSKYTIYYFSPELVDLAHEVVEHVGPAVGTCACGRRCTYHFRTLRRRLPQLLLTSSWLADTNAPLPCRCTSAAPPRLAGHRLPASAQCVRHKRSDRTIYFDHFWRGAHLRCHWSSYLCFGIAIAIAISLANLCRGGLRPHLWPQRTLTARSRRRCWCFLRRAHELRVRILAHNRGLCR